MHSNSINILNFSNDFLFKTEILILWKWVVFNFGNYLIKYLVFNIRPIVGKHDSPQNYSKILKIVLKNVWKKFLNLC